jgi:putative DNA primase/helicase
MNSHDMAADLATRFRLSRRPRSWSGDCPACSYPRAFSVRVGKGSRPLLFCANGCTRKVLDDAARHVVQDAWTPPPRPPAAEGANAGAAKQAAAERLWTGSRPCPATPAALYLAGRGIGHACASDALRFHADCPHPEGTRLPAMVALVQNVDGQHVGCHRTYLTLAGGKAAADPGKASLGPVWGGAVRLDPEAPELVIAEGIETAASAGLLLCLSAWAAISAGNLASGVLLPAGVRRVVIAVDPDAPGERAAHDAAKRWQREGRTVRFARPDGEGDFNDLLLAREASHA